MYITGLTLFAVLITTVSGHNLPDTRVQNCVYTFTVPPTEDMCPPGSKDASSEEMDNLKDYIESQFSELTKQITNLTKLLHELNGSQENGGNNCNKQDGAPKSGSHYTRWGHSGCPPSSELLYTGYAGKSNFNHGGGVDYQCLPSEPDFADGAASGTQSQSYIYGVEYETNNSPAVPGGRHNNDVPCAVCHVSDRGEQIMIPAKQSCPTSWTKEYEGILMSQHNTHTGSTFACVDKEMETVPGGHANDNGGLLYAVEVKCGSLPCPPYQDNFELPCVVCTL